MAEEESVNHDGVQEKSISGSVECVQRPRGTVCPVCPKTSKGDDV